MNTKTTISISEARKRIFDIANDVNNASGHYVLTDKGRGKAVIMSLDEFESMVETLEVMRDFPNLNKDIEEAHEDYRTGRYLTYATLDDILKKEGYIQTGGKLTRKNAVRHKVQGLSPKGARKNSRKR